MTDVERVARAIWPEIGTDYTYDEAVARANGHPDDEVSAASHQSTLKYVADLARAALDAMPAVGVRKLEWITPSPTTDGQWQDTTGIYDIEECILFIGHVETGIRFESVKAAKAAAQADYERRIRSALTPAPDPVAEAARMKNLIDSIVFAHNGLQRMCDRAWAGEIETCPREFSRSIWGAFEDIKRSLPTELTAHWDETLKKIKLNMAREGKDLPSIYDKASDVAEAARLRRGINDIAQTCEQLAARTKAASYSTLARQLRALTQQTEGEDD